MAFKQALDFFPPFGLELKNKMGKPFDKDNEDSNLYQWVDDQDDWIDETKKQLSLIETFSSPGGSMLFDIPPHLRKTGKAQRDHYTCVMIATWFFKHYLMMMESPREENTSFFEPFAI
ncbi:MAG: hypothetical protein HC836_12670 [Richelia sp. RM2_1_2]|nr:hypothetical protein [Richelia sp. RM2_1_2]